MLASQLEEVLHQLLRLAEPLGYEVGAGHTEKGRVVGLGGHGLG